MRTVLRAKTFELTPDVREYAEKKMQALSRFINPENVDSLVTIDLSRGQHHRRGDVFKVAAKLTLPGRVLYASAHGETVFQAIDTVETSLKREIRRHYAKKKDVRLKGLQRLKEITRFLGLGKEK